ncbi:MAG: transposase [Anaerolineae bacterium]|nr:transposase [Anaerolineae bacterium]
MAGLGASVHDSGHMRYHGGITKQGRSEMRSTLVEAAWMAVRYSRYWAERFETLAGRIGRGKAIVAIARRLLVTVWHVLAHESMDRHADPKAVARKVMHWGDDCRREARHGLSRVEFARDRLAHLGLLSQVQRFTYAGDLYELAGPDPASAQG